MKNMSIKQKFIISFLGVLISVIALFIISFYSISSIKTFTKNLEKSYGDLVLIERIISKHNEYIRNLLLSSRKKVTFENKADHKNCILGKWYYKLKESETFAHLPSNLKQDFANLEEVHEKLHELAKIYNEDVENPKVDIPNKTSEYLKVIVNTLENYATHLKEINKKINSESDTLFSNSMWALIICIGIIVIFLFLLFFTQRYIMNSILNLQTYLEGFFDFLGRKRNDIEAYPVKNKDEIGIMMESINERLKFTFDGIQKDIGVVGEIISFSEKLGVGDYNARIFLKANDPRLNHVAKELNNLANTLKTNSDNIVMILEEFTEHNYLNKIDTSNIKFYFEKLANGTNFLGDAITEMLVENKSNGLTLNDTSNVLLKNVDLLNRNSNDAAAALEETAAALEEVTSNISLNNENVSKMADFAIQLTSSSNEGQKLAHETTLSMEEINTQVNSISEAITIIDQIAFQTNILSLNAAVEAATAGEAGKGFAVVAQEVRNLAARSAEAANEIKAIVENATQKANNGKIIADKMIQGYSSLNENISRTMNLIKDIETASKEQLKGIEQINDAVTNLDKQTQQNASIASQAHSVAVQTDNIAKLIVSNANAKQFNGKDLVESKR